MHPDGARDGYRNYWIRRPSQPLQRSVMHDDPIHSASDQECMPWTSRDRCGLHPDCEPQVAGCAKFTAARTSRYSRQLVRSAWTSMHRPTGVWGAPDRRRCSTGSSAPEERSQDVRPGRPGRLRGQHNLDRPSAAAVQSVPVAWLSQSLSRGRTRGRRPLHHLELRPTIRRPGSQPTYCKAAPRRP